MENKGQVTIFIILAILLVASAVVYFLVRDKVDIEGLPASIEPVYNTFLFCLEEDTLVGINVLESQAGYINLPNFEPGSPYMPFSSHLDFLGNPIPYWYYVSGNNIQKEQVPSKSLMEEELEGFIEQEIRDCIFESYYENGYEIDLGEPKADVNIRDNEVEINLDMNMDISYGNDTSIIKNHHVIVNSKLGSLYNSAKMIYEEEQDSLFLENYAVDTLRLYAPVNGVELTCSPLTWVADEVFDELEQAIEANTLSLKVKDGDYNLRKKENNYFVVDVIVEPDTDVRFLNSKKWPNSFEVLPSEGSVLISEPVGNQPGLGVLGFCYVPYHFVYNVKYPVLVQVYSGDEIFQFPVAIVIQGNRPRKALDASAVEEEDSELCKYQNTLIDVNTYDTSLNPIDAEISYKCFETRCYIGKTVSGSLLEEFPQCVNGYVLAKSEGYENAKYLYSTIQEGSVDIIMDKLYEMQIELDLDNKAYGGYAIISFVSDKASKTVVYPEQKSVELGEGQYEIQVYIYKNSSLKIEKNVQEKCIEVPDSGVGGIFGFTDEQCFDIEIPEQIISNALSGGGKENYYILESELQDSTIIDINAGSLPTPKSIDDLQNNYILFEGKELDIEFK